MIVKVRETLTATEYWDTEKKLTLSVPRGVKPAFKVTENPESMLDSKLEKRETTKVDKEEQEAIDYTTMTISALTSLAAERNIDLGKAKKKSEIIEVLMSND